MKLSAIIIAKNAENDVADAISSVTFADEIIVIDSGSQDRTVALAEKLGAKVFLHESSNFSELRNYGLKKAKGEWILYIDSDERATGELVVSIKYQVLRGNDNQFSTFRIKRKNFYLGNNEWPHIEKMERLFRRDKLKSWRGELHETPIFDGEIGELNGFLLHYTHRDLSSMLKKTIQWSSIEAELRLREDHPKMTWWRFLRVATTAFFDSYIKQSGWKAGTAGLIESIYQSFSMFITYAKLWELQQKIKSENA